MRIQKLTPIKIVLDEVPRKLGTEADLPLEQRLLEVQQEVSGYVREILNKVDDPSVGTNLAKFVGADDVQKIAIASQTGSTNVGGSILVKKTDGTIESVDFEIDDRHHGKYSKTCDVDGKYINNPEIEEGRLELNALYELFAFISEHAKVKVQAYQSHAGVDLNTLVNLENRGKAKASVERHSGKAINFDKEHYFIRNNRNVAGINSYIKGIFPERMPLHFAGMMNRSFSDNAELTIRIPHAKHAKEVFNSGKDKKFSIDIMNDSEGPLTYATHHLKGDAYEGRNAVHIIGGTGCNVAIGTNLVKDGDSWSFSGGTLVTEAGHDATTLFDKGWDRENFGKTLEPFRNRDGKPGESSYEDLVAGCPKEEIDRGIKGTFNYIKALSIASKHGMDAVLKDEFKDLVNFVEEPDLKLTGVADLLRIMPQAIEASSLIANDTKSIKDSYEIQKAAESGDEFAKALLKNWIFRVGRLLAARYGEVLKNSAYISFTGSHIVRCMERVEGLKDAFKEGLKDGGLPSFGRNDEKLILIDTRAEAVNEDEKWDNTYFMAKNYLAKTVA